MASSNGSEGTLGASADVDSEPSLYQAESLFSRRANTLLTPYSCLNRCIVATTSHEHTKAIPDKMGSIAEEACDMLRASMPPLSRKRPGLARQC